MKRRMQKRILLVLLSAISTAVLLTGCSFFNGADAQKTVKLGIQPGIAVSEIAQSSAILEDYLSEQDVALEYVEFTYGPAMVEALAADQIDIAFMGNLPVFTGVSNGTDLKVIYLTLLSENGINGIIAGKNSGIENVSDLEGKSVGVSIGSAAHLGLELLLNEENLTLDDVTLVNLTAADMASSLANQEIDAAALWETNLTKTQIKADGTLIATSKSVMEDQTFLVGTEKFFEENSMLTDYIVAGVIQVEDYIVANPEKCIEEIVDRTGDSADAWQYVLGMTKATGFTDDTYETARLAKDFLEKNDLVQNDYDYRSLFDDTYWNNAKNILASE